MSENAYTTADVAKLFDMTTQSVDAWRGKEGAPLWDPDTRRFDRDGVNLEVQKRVRAAEARLRRLQVAAVELDVPLTAYAAASDPLLTVLGQLEAANAAMSAAIREAGEANAGRAAAEERIEGLKEDLRRSNAALDQLRANPDRDLDSL
jgi:hypothetical protein